MSRLREDMEALLEGKKRKKPVSNIRWAARKVKKYFKPVVQKKSYKRAKRGTKASPRR